MCLWSLKKGVGSGVGSGPGSRSINLEVRIRIRTKMSRIRNTDPSPPLLLSGTGGVRGEADRVPEGAGVLGAQAGGAGHSARHQADPHSSHPPLQGISVVDLDLVFLD